MFTQETWKHDSTKELYANVHGGIIQNSPGVEMIQMSITGKWINELWYICIILYSSVTKRTNYENTPWRGWISKVFCQAHAATYKSLHTVESVSMKFWVTQNESILTSISEWLRGGRGVWGRGTKEFSRVMEIFGILLGVWITWVQAFVKTQQTVHLRSTHYMCMLSYTTISKKT